MSLPIDPAGLTNSAGAPVPALTTGNYTINATVRAILPGTTPVTVTFPASTTSVQYVSPNDRSFSRGFSATGVSRLRVDSTGISLNRSNGTSTRFAKIGTTFTTPEGSFTTAESFAMNVPDPLGGADRVAAYQLTSTSGMISLYSAAGLLLERSEANGDVIRFAYQDQKNDGTADDLVRVQSSTTGQSVDYGYVSGRIQTVTDSAGRAWTYVYDAVSGLLTSMTGPAPQVGLPAPRVVMTYHPGTTRIASYTSTDTASTFTETTEVDWDAAGNVSQIRKLDTQGTSGGTRTWTFQSAESRQTNQIRVTDPLLTIDSQDAYDQVTFPDGSISKSVLDAYGNVIREERTVLGYLANTVITTSYTRNADGQLTVDGPMEQRVGTAAATVIPAITYGYDSVGRKTAASYPDGSTEVWTFNAGATAAQPSTYKNRVGHYFTYGPYSDSFPTQINQFSSNGGTLISQTRYTYVNGRVKTVAMTDLNGLNGTGIGVEMYYDNRLNLIHSRTTTATDAGVIAPAAATDIWVSYGYNAQDNLVWSTSEYQATALVGVAAVPSLTDVNLLAVRTQVTTDSQGRILTSLSPAPGAGQARLQTTMTYDAIGRPLTSVEPGTTAVATRRTTVAYNSFGEVRRTVLPDPDDAGPLAAASTLYVYDVNGFAIETRQMNGASVVSRKRFGFDSLGRMRFESMAMSASALLLTNELTQYEYDAAGRVTKTSSPVGRAGLAENMFLVTSQVYDDVERRITTSVSTYGTAVISPVVADVVQEFDAIGRPTKIAQGTLSRTMRYLDASTFAGKGTLVAINDERTSDTDLATTKQWWVKYGPTGLVRRTQTPDPDGTGPLALLDVITSYDYRGNVDTVREQSGTLTRTTDYTFDFRDLLQTVTTPAPSAGLPGLVTTYGYDKLQRQVSETGPSGVAQVIGWRDDGLLGTLSRNDNSSPVPGVYTTYGYDNLNRVTGVTTPDGLSTVAYDALGNVSQTRSPDPDGTGPLTPMSMTYIYATNTAGQFLQETLDTNNSQTRFSFDSAGRMIEQFRPKNLNPAGSDYATVYAEGTASTTPTETWTYDAIGRLQRSTDALGNFITYQYDSLSRLTSVGDTTRQQSYVYDAVDGDLTSSTDPLGRTTQFTSYDNLGRLTQSQRMLGTSVSDVSTVAYDGFGRVSQTKALAGVAGNEMVTGYEYDLLDRQTKVIDPLLGQTNYIYDVRGFLSRVDDERNHSTFLNYDNIGRLSAQWTEGFSQTIGSQRYSYDAMDRVATSTDPLNNVTTYAYDKLGRQISKTDPALAAGVPVTTYSYDLDGNLASVTDPSLNVTSYKYDHRNRLREDSITLNGVPAVREYWYTDTDKLFWSKDRDNRWTRYQYDFAFGAADNYRLTTEAWWISGNIFNNQITWSYDNAQGNGLLVTEVNDRKNLQTSDTVTSRVGFTYDQLARVVTTTDWLQPGLKGEAFELKYLYADGVDRRTGTEARFAKFNTTTGAQTNNYFDFRNSYVWDQLNRVDNVTQRSASDPLAATWTANATTTRTVDLSYFADSTLQSISRTQGAAGATTAAMVTTFTTVADGSKNAGRIASITQSGLTGGNAAYAYTYDDHGRIASFASPGGTRTYSYDTFDQVTGASGAAQTAEAFSYDTNGNRTNGSVVTGQYNRIVSDATYSYLYDKEGNRTRRTTISTGEYEAYAWDYRQRLVSITKYSSANVLQWTLSYEYDGLDRRTRRTVRNSAGTVTVQQRFLYETNALSSLLPLGGEGGRRADERRS
jgi:YD repeat-containing protein